MTQSNEPNRYTVSTTTRRARCACPQCDSLAKRYATTRRNGDKLTTVYEHLNGPMGRIVPCTDQSEGQ